MNQVFATIVLNNIDKDKVIELDNQTFYHIEKEGILSLNNLKATSWTKSTNGGNFGVLKNVIWLKYEFDNTSNEEFNSFLFLPFFLVNEIDVYQEIDNNIKLIKKLGRYRDINNNDKVSKGWTINLNFPKNKSTIYIKVKHLFLPIRVSAFLIQEKKLEQIIVKAISFYSLWKGVFIFAIFISIIFAAFLLKKVYLYYFFFNIGVYLSLNIEFGAYYSFFSNDYTNRIYEVQKLANLLFIVFFPLFLNELLPIKKKNPKMWNSLKFGNAIFILFWLLSIPTSIRVSEFYYYATFYYLSYAVVTLLVVLYFLFKMVILKVKDSRSLFIVYLIFILVTIFDGYARTFGFAKDSVYIYNSILYSSMFQVIVFLFLITFKIYHIYIERNNLVLVNNQHDLDVVKAVVESQETERNIVGRELHDHIGANLSVIKQNIKKTDGSLVKLIDSTIDTIRLMSHGLISPKIDGLNFEDEIKDFLLLSENNSFKVKYYFHKWPILKTQTLATHLYRIVQELIQNAIKHSRSSEVYIQFLNHGNKLTIMYEDNGIGFDLTKDIHSGRGIINIENRIALINASINFDTSSNGTTVTIELNND